MPPPEPTTGTARRPLTIGWDVGGAHLKACLWRDGRPLAVRQVACALWQGLDRLEAAIAALAEAGPDWAAALRDPRARHAVTMTGEMVDHFVDRAAGVAAITGLLAARLAPATVWFHAGDGRWLDAADAAADWPAVASANWRASAAHAASRVGEGVWIDIGSTTTDIVVLRDGRVAGESRSDADRLASGELVYQGVVRTPLAALAERIAFGPRAYNVMHEWFATTADVYRLTGQLDPSHDLHPSADQGPKDELGSARRLARMIGQDATPQTLPAWRAFAATWRALQIGRIAASLQRALALHPVRADAPFVAAGCGAFLVRALAAADGRRVVGYDTVALAGPSPAAGNGGAPASAEAGEAPASLRSAIGVCAPAVAVAALADAAGTGLAAVPARAGFVSAC